MPPIFFICFYLTKGGALSIRGSDIRVFILMNNFFDVKYFLINIIKKKSFCILFFDIKFT